MFVDAPYVSQIEMSAATIAIESRIAAFLDRIAARTHVTFNPRGVAVNHRIIGHIFCDDRPRSDEGAPADRHAANDRRVGSDAGAALDDGRRVIG